MRGEETQSLLDALGRELGTGIVLEDPHQRLLAHTDHGDLIDDVRRASILGRRATASVRAWFEQWGIRDARKPLRTPADSRLGVLERWCVPIRFRGSHLGYIWVLDGGTIREGDLLAAVETAEAIGPVLYRREVTAQADASLLRLLLLPNADTEYAAGEIRASWAFAHRGPVAVVVAGPVGGDPLSRVTSADLSHAVREAAEQTSPGPALTGMISDHVVALAPLRTPEDLGPARRIAENLRLLASRVGGGLQLLAGIGDATDLERVARSYRGATLALRILRAIPELGPVAAWEELGVFRALAMLPGDGDATALDRRVGALLEHPELSATAETFLDLAGDVQSTAARLHLHRATLYQRLARIKSAYGLDLRRSGEHRLITHLGLKQARLTRRTADV